MTRPILSRRDPGVEKLLVGIPDYAAPTEIDDTRRWAVAMMSSASRWLMDKRKRNSLARFGGRAND